MSLNIKNYAKSREAFFKTNNISLDFASSPIKNIKKIIKRNTRASSFNSFVYNKTEGILKNSNPFTIGIQNINSSSKLMLKKNTFTNIKKNIPSKSKKKHNKAKTKDITVRPSTSNYRGFILSKQKNLKINLRNNFQHSFLFKSNDIIGGGIDGYSLGDKADTIYQNNNMSKNKLLLTHFNNNSKRTQEKNKSTIFQSGKHHIVIEPIFQSNKKFIDFNRMSGISKTKTTKNSKGKSIKKFKSNKYLANTNYNNSEISSDDQLGIINDFDYCLYKNLKNDINKKISRQYIHSNKNKKKKSRDRLRYIDGIYIDQNFLTTIISENKLIKQKNEELSLKFDGIKNEFELIKKDNKNIKEELKEKTKFLQDMKTTLDFFSKELIKLQNLNKSVNNELSSNNSNNTQNNSCRVLINNNQNLNNNTNKNMSNNEKKIINNINNNNNNNLIEKQNIISQNTNQELISAKNVSTNLNSNNTESENNNNINNINNNSNIKKTKIEKIHQLPLKNIMQFCQMNNKCGSLENNSSKNFYKETKDTTEKDVDGGHNKLSPVGSEDKAVVSEKEESESLDFTSISLAENLNIDEESYKFVISKINNNQLIQNENLNEIKNKKNAVCGLPKKLNFIKQKNSNDFNEEFLKNYDKFSDSWRREVEKMMKRNSNPNNNNNSSNDKSDDKKG